MISSLIVLWLTVGVIVAECNRAVYHIRFLHYILIFLLWPIQLTLNILDHYKVPMPKFIRDFLQERYLP